MLHHTIIGIYSGNKRLMFCSHKHILLYSDSKILRILFPALSSPITFLRGESMMLTTAILWISFAFSLISLIAGILNQSWKLALLSFFLLLPLGYALTGAENVLRFLSCLPAVPLVLAVIFYFQSGRRNLKEKGK